MGLIPRTLERLGRRRTYVMVDQAVSGLSNVVVAVIVARKVAPEAFGAFSVAMVAYQLGLGGVRAVVGEPWLSAHSADAADSRVRPSADLARAAVLASAVAAVAIAVPALAVGGRAEAPLLALAVTFPVLGLQDALRYVVVVDRPQIALASDLAWLVAVVALLGVAPHAAGPAWYVLAWSAGALIGLVVAARAADVPATGGSARRWLATHREMSGAFFGEFATARAVGYLVLLALGAIAGLRALGAVRAAQVFYGPLNTLFAGAYLALVPDGAQRRDEPHRLVRLMVAASVLVTGAAAVWMTVGLVMPDGWGVALFGATWSRAHDVMLPMGLAVIAGSVSTGAFAGIRSLGAARLSLRVRLWSMPPQATFALVGAVWGAAVGYAFGFALGNAVVATMWWVAFLGLVRPGGAGGATGDRPWQDTAVGLGG